MLKFYLYGEGWLSAPILTQRLNSWQAQTHTFTLTKNDVRLAEDIDSGIWGCSNNLLYVSLGFKYILLLETLMASSLMIRNFTTE